MKKSHKKTSLEEMNRAALAHHTTYAELQRRETVEMIDPIRAPKGYRKAGERKDEYKTT